MNDVRNLKNDVNVTQQALNAISTLLARKNISTHNLMRVMQHLQGCAKARVPCSDPMLCCVYLCINFDNSCLASYKCFHRSTGQK